MKYLTSLCFPNQRFLCLLVCGFGCFIAACNKPATPPTAATPVETESVTGETTAVETEQSSQPKDVASEQSVATETVAEATTEPEASDATAPKDPTDELVDLLIGDSSLKGAFAGDETPAHLDHYVPSKNSVMPDWLDQRAKDQLATRDQFEVFHNFKFTNHQETSGIDWEATSVEDAGKYYVAAHYDHGNGIAIADVDADGLFDIYLTSQIGANALFRNLGDGKFENISTAGIELADRISVTASFADIDNDGDADLFVTTVRGGNALFRNDGKGNFEDISKEAGVDYVGHSSAAVFFDYDRDGMLDLFVTNVGIYTNDEKGTGGYYRSVSGAFAGHLKPERVETSLLYRNIDGTKFEEVSASMNLVDDSWSGAATPVDVNEDGWIDLYTTDMQGHDEYFENQGGKSFKKRSREVFPKTPWGAMGVKVFDYNNDGRMDIYVTDMHSDMSEHVSIEKEKLKSNITWDEDMLKSNGQSIFGNAFFEKQADGSYVEVSDKIGAENYWPWGLSVGDLNADGFEDAFVASSMNFPLRYGINTVLLNNQGKQFLDSEFILGIEPREEGKQAKPWFKLDCDGPEVENKFAKRYEIKSGMVTVWGPLGSRSSVIFDYDNDGDQDIITNDFNSEPLVFESNLSDQKPVHFIKVKLVGKKSNRDGLGAMVQVVAGNSRYTKVHDGQSGYISQSSNLLYFGLGDAEAVDEILVTWPSGIKQVVKPTAINDVLVITEEG